MKKLWWVLFMLTCGLVVYRSCRSKPSDGKPENVTIHDSTGSAWASLTTDTPGWTKQLTIVYLPTPTPRPNGWEYQPIKYNAR